MTPTPALSPRPIASRLAEPLLLVTRLPGMLVGFVFVWALALLVLADANIDRKASVQRQADLLARLVEEQTSRRLLDHESAAQRARVLLQTAEGDAESSDPTVVLSESVTGHDSLQLHLVETDGRILASSSSARLPSARALNGHPAQVSGDLVAMLAAHPAAVSQAGNTAWHLLAGDEISGARDLDQGIVADAHLLVRAWPVTTAGSAARRWLVASFDPLDLAAEHAIVIGDADWRSTLFDREGRVLAVSGRQSLPVGAHAAVDLATASLATPDAARSMAALPRATREGLDGSPAVGSIRTLHRAPYAVLVDLPDSVVDKAGSGTRLRVLGAAIAASLLVVAYGLALRRQRDQRRHAEAESMAAHARAARSEAEMRSLVDGLPEWMFRTDPQGHVVFVNHHWLVLSGHDAAAALGRPLADLVHPADALVVHNLFDFELAGVDPGSAAGGVGESGTRLVRLVTASGEERQIELTVAPLSRDGRLGYAGFGVDVTEREAIRRQASAQYRLTEQLVDAIPQPIFLTDMAGDLLMVNRSWVEWMGLDGAAGRAEDLSLVQQVLAHGLDEVRVQGRLSAPLELPVGRSRVRETVMTKVLLRQDGPQPVGVIGTLVDVTEFREAERTTERALRAAESASQSRTEFVANVSHELRTPLQSIIGFAELGRDRSESGSRPQAMFSRIHDSGHRMLKLVEDLLDVSRLGSAVGQVRPQLLPLVPAVAEVVDELQSLANSRGLRLVFSAPPELAERTAMIDPLRFGQVVRNVVANAMRFAPAASVVEISTRNADGIAITTVRDHGPGIPEDELDSIFEPFVQSSRTRDGSGGTGLGLAICRRIMMGLGGFIHADNHPRGGAVFHIGLRWAADQKNSTLDASDLAADGDGDAAPDTALREEAALPG